MLCAESNRNGPCYKRKILRINYRKVTILWSFSYNYFVKLHSKKFVNLNMTVLYQNLCYNEVYYIGIAIYFETALLMSSTLIPYSPN